MIKVDIESNKNYKFDFDILLLSKKLLKETLKICKLDGDYSVNLSLVSNSVIKKINKSERGIDKITDVLSFPNIPFKKPANIKVFMKNGVIDHSIVDLISKTIFLGDIVISYDKIIEQSKMYGHSIKREFSFLFVHSVLHLLGFDHMKKIDEKKMFSLQEKILKNLKIHR